MFCRQNKRAPSCKRRKGRYLLGISTRNKNLSVRLIQMFPLRKQSAKIRRCLQGNQKRFRTFLSHEKGTVPPWNFHPKQKPFCTPHSNVSTAKTKCTDTEMFCQGTKRGFAPSCHRRKGRNPFFTGRNPFFTANNFLSVHLIRKSPLHKQPKHGNKDVLQKNQTRFRTSLSHEKGTKGPASFRYVHCQTKDRVVTSLKCSHRGEKKKVVNVLRKKSKTSDK